MFSSPPPLLSLFHYLKCSHCTILKFPVSYHTLIFLLKRSICWFIEYCRVKAVCRKVNENAHLCCKTSNEVKISYKLFSGTVFTWSLKNCKHQLYKPTCLSKGNITVLIYSCCALHTNGKETFLVRVWFKCICVDKHNS